MSSLSPQVKEETTEKCGRGGAGEKHFGKTTTTLLERKPVFRQRKRKRGGEVYCQFFGVW